MSLRRLQITDFRCLQSVAIELDPAFTLISGGNASGKTSLLEAVYVLGRGRSFRTRRTEQLIRRGSARFTVFGESQSSTQCVPMGIEGSAEGVRARIAGAPAANLAELALRLPVQIIDPEVHRLVEEGPHRRRRFLDWGVFHVEHDFVSHWQRYSLVLRQRNAALKQGEFAHVAAWNAELIRHGNWIDDARRRYVGLLARHCAPIAERLLGEELSLKYRSGWSVDQTFAEVLASNAQSDRELGFTQQGPHRADLAIRLQGLTVKDRISRGQQKLLAAALLMAQLELFPDSTPCQPTLLLDDPAAELDGEHLWKIIQEVSSLSVQLIVTTLHAEFSAFGTPGQRYLVESGQVAVV